MSLINSGFDGTVTERDFSRILRGAGVRDSVETAAAWAVTQGTGRQVSVAPGVAYAAGVVSDSGVAILAALPTPVNGQWHLVVRRINWASNTVTVATIPHTTTTTAIPTAPPAGFPVFNDNTGVLVDQHLAWAWVRSTDTTVAVFDLRQQPLVRTLGVDLPVANFAALPAVGNFVGRQVTALDTGITFRWSGSAWVSWESPSIAYTPTLTAVTLGTGGTNVGSYRFVTGRVVADILITLGTGGSVGTNPAATLPVTRAVLPSFILMNGTVSLYDASTLGSFKGGSLAASITEVRFQSFGLGPSTAITATVPFTWTVSDVIMAQVEYVPA